jgi:hypothetical protein
MQDQIAPSLTAAATAPVDSSKADIVVRIRDIDAAAKQIKVNAQSVSPAGDITLSKNYDQSDGTNIEFKLSGKLDGAKYTFNDKPICIVQSSDAKARCSADDPLPAYFTFVSSDKKSLMIKATDLPAGVNFKYNLFLSNGAQGIVIDPRIGCCQVNYSFVQTVINQLGDYADIGFGVLVAVAAALGFGTARVFRK